jgi:predicted patatin/cPLA2 family phospholipase
MCRLLAGPPLEYGGDRYLDATVRLSIPFEAALRVSCTHLFVRRTRAEGTYRQSPSFLERHVVGRALGRIDARLEASYLQRAEAYSDELDDLERLAGAQAPPYAFSVLPSSGAVIRSSERDRDRVYAATCGGVLAVYRIWEGGREPVVADVLRVV